ncbi:MAG: AsmA family protein [Neisseriaceae bacterium]|nr:AsmA family protein [Neisseriaceae bacterium]
MRYLLRSGKFWFKLACAIVIMAIGIAIGQVLLVRILDQNTVEAAIHNAFNQRGYTVEFDGEVSHSWFPAPNINLSRISVFYHGNKVIYVDKMNLRVAYSSLFSRPKLSKVTVYRPEIWSKRLIDGSWDLENLFKNPLSERQLPDNIVIHSGTINLDQDVKQWRAENVYLSGKNLNRKQSKWHTQFDWTRGLPYTTLHIALITSLEQNSKSLWQFNNLSGRLQMNLPHLHDIDANVEIPQLQFNHDTQIITANSLIWRGIADNQKLSFNGQGNDLRITEDDSLAKMQSSRVVVHWLRDGNQWSANTILKDIIWQDKTIRANAKLEGTRKTNQNAQLFDIDTNINFFPISGMWHLDNTNIQTRQTKADGTSPSWQTDLNGKATFWHNGQFNIFVSGVLDGQSVHANIKRDAIIEVHDTDDSSNDNLESLPEDQSNNPVIKLSADIDVLNLTPYLDYELVGKTDSEELLEDWNRMLDKTTNLINQMKDYHVDAEVKIGQMHWRNSEAHDISGRLLFNRDGWKWAPVTAHVYGGEFFGSVAMENTPVRRYVLEQKMENVYIHDWLADLLGRSYFSGKANATMQLTMEGNDVKTLLSNLGGNIVLNIEDGALHGIDATSLLKNRNNISTAFMRPQVFEQNVLTPFRFLSFQTRWVKGVGYTPLMVFDSPVFSAEGEGRIDLNQETLDYSLLLSGKLSANDIQNTRLPLRINGNIKSPNYALDYAAITQNFQRQEDKQRAVQSVLQQRWTILKPSNSD